MIELKIQASTPEAMRDAVAALGLVFQSGFIAPNDTVTVTARSPDTETVPESDTETVPEPEPAPEPAKKRGRPRKPATEPVPDVEPAPEVVTEEDEAEALGADEPPAEPEPAPKPAPVPLSAPVAVPKAAKPAKPELTLDDLRAATKRVMEVHGIPECLKRLKRVGYTKASEVPPERYEDAINALLQDD